MKSTENDPDKGHGLYRKFEVRRTNPDIDVQARHEDCDYFVLDLTHDPLALAAIDEYERQAFMHGYTALAEDLRLKRAQRKLR